MKQQATVSSIREKRPGAVEYRSLKTRQGDFDRRLDAVVQRFLEHTGEPTDGAYAMRWAIARYQRTQSSFAKGVDHVAAQMAA